MFKRIVKDTSTLSLGTLVSRILGFLRDVLIARFFGTSGILEAFIVSFRLPNLFRSIFAEGFSDSVATPVLSQYRENKNELFKIGNNLFSLSLIILPLFTILGIIFSRYLVLAIAPGFVADAYKFNLAVSFSRITFFYLLFIGLSANITSLLYSLRKFFIPAINPIFLNLSFIVGILFFGRFFRNYILAVSVIAGGLLEVIFPFISLKKEGFALRLWAKGYRRDKNIITMLKLFIPRIWASIIYHLNVFVDTIFSSLTQIVGEGALAAVYYANRLIQFPLALIALSVSQVAIVDLSAYHAQGNTEDFKRLFVFSFQNIVFFVFPITAVFIFISQGIIDVIFKRGEFDHASLLITSSVFFFYSLGLFFFCGVKLLVTSFYSLRDTRTPAITATMALILNVALSAILMFPLKIGGVALGSSLAAMFNFFILYYYLIKKIGRIDWQDTKSQLIKVLILSLITGGGARLLWEVLTGNKYFKMSIIIAVTSLIFLAGASIFNLKQMRYLKELILSKASQPQIIK